MVTVIRAWNDTFFLKHQLLLMSGSFFPGEQAPFFKRDLESIIKAA